jgi:hypothetical protein
MSGMSYLQDSRSLCHRGHTSYNLIKHSEDDENPEDRAKRGEASSDVSGVHWLTFLSQSHPPRLVATVRSVPYWMHYASRAAYVVRLSFIPAPCG